MDLLATFIGFTDFERDSFPQLLIELGLNQSVLLDSGLGDLGLDIAELQERRGQWLFLGGEHLVQTFAGVQSHFAQRVVQRLGLLYGAWSDQDVLCLGRRRGMGQLGQLGGQAAGKFVDGLVDVFRVVVRSVFVDRSDA